MTSTAVVASDPPAQTGKRTLFEEAAGAKSAKRSHVLDRESSDVITEKIIKDNFPGWAVERTDVRKHPTTGLTPGEHQDPCEAVEGQGPHSAQARRKRLQ